MGVLDPVEVIGGPPRITRDALFSAVRSYVAGTKVSRAVVFGSFARGEADAESDLDILLLERTGRPFLERGLAHLPLFHLGIGVDLLVYTPEEYVGLLADGNPLIERIEREGIQIYARPEG